MCPEELCLTVIALLWFVHLVASLCPCWLFALSPNPPGPSPHLSSVASLYHMSSAHSGFGREAFTQGNRETTCRLELCTVKTPDVLSAPLPHIEVERK